MGSLASFTLEWDSAGRIPGTYAIRAELLGADGYPLARADRPFGLGLAEGEITALSATPDLFAGGEAVDVSLSFANTGSTPLSGTAVVRVQDDSGTLLQEFSHDYVDLSPGTGTTFPDTWQSPEAAEGRYQVVAYVLYNSASTELATVVISTDLLYYLPLIRR